jgi:tetratricopeptide (TPR) repeat protein
MIKRYLLQSSRLLWIVVILLGFAAISWTTVASRFAGNVGLLLLARSLSSSDQLGLMSEGSNRKGQEQAWQWLHMATALKHDNRGAWRGLGFVLVTRGQANSAIAAWQTAGGMPQEFIARGQAIRPADPQAALIWYEWAVRIDPDFLEAQVLRCYSHIDSKGFRQALEAYAHIDSAGQHNVSMLACAGTAHWQLGEYANAAIRFEEAVKLHPETGSLHQWLSLTYARLGQYPDAIAESLTAVELNSSRPDYWHHLGNLYLMTKQYDAAKNAYEHVLAIIPDDQQAKQSLAEISRQLK